MRQNLDFVAFFATCVKLSIQKIREIFYNNIGVYILLKGFQ